MNRYLRQADNLDLKKFLLLNLAAVNEKKNLLNDAIKNVVGAADIALTYREKRELFMKGVELWVKLGDFMMAEKAFHKALGYANEFEGKDMQTEYFELFRIRGSILENEGETRKAIDTYERLFAITKFEKKKLEMKLIQPH